MIVECIIDSVEDIRNHNLREYVRPYNREPHLIIGQQYSVFGMFSSKWGLSYFIADEWYAECPSLYHEAFFKIIDSTYSTYWVPNVDELIAKQQRYLAITFPEWTNDDTFYELLVDGNKKHVEIFDKYRRLIDIENGIDPDGYLKFGKKIY